MDKFINVEEARAYALEHFPSPVVRRPIEEVLDRCAVVEFEPIVQCKDCIHCVEINEKDKWLYDDNVFECNIKRGDMCEGRSVIYGTEYCSDGKRRDEHAVD